MDSSMRASSDSQPQGVGLGAKSSALILACGAVVAAILVSAIAPPDAEAVAEAGASR
jgi:hypothetical protein